MVDKGTRVGTRLRIVDGNAGTPERRNVGNAGNSDVIESGDGLRALGGIDGADRVDARHRCRQGLAFRGLWHHFTTIEAVLRT